MSKGVENCQEVIICIYGFLYVCNVMEWNGMECNVMYLCMYVCFHYTLDTFQFQVCFSIGKILSVLGG